MKSKPIYKNGEFYCPLHTNNKIRPLIYNGYISLIANNEGCYCQPKRPTTKPVSLKRR